MLRTDIAPRSIDSIRSHNFQHVFSGCRSPATANSLRVTLRRQILHEFPGLPFSAVFGLLVPTDWDAETRAAFLASVYARRDHVSPLILVARARV